MNSKDVALRIASLFSIMKGIPPEEEIEILYKFSGEQVDKIENFVLAELNKLEEKEYVAWVANELDQLQKLIP